MNYLAHSRLRHYPSGHMRIFSSRIEREPRAKNGKKRISFISHQFARIWGILHNAKCGFSQMWGFVESRNNFMVSTLISGIGMNAFA